jgi:two-component system response regulator AdeR
MTSRKILLIKGGITQNNIIAAEIEKAGYTLLLAKSTFEAIRLIKTEKPCLVVMTCGLPLSVSTNSLSRIRKISEVPILTIGDRDSAVTMLERGADAYLETPISEYVFVSKINAILRRRKYSKPPKNQEQKLVTYY